MVNIKVSIEYCDGSVQQEPLDDYGEQLARVPRPHEDRKHERWIVITTIQGPTSDVLQLSKLQDWKLVVVGDRKTPDDWQ